MSSPFALMAQQLAAAAAAMDRERRADHCQPRQNPHKGMLRRDSVTHRVYRELLLSYPSPLQAWELRQSCQAGRGAVAWAVRFLRKLGRIDCLSDDGRHLHYLRYRARIEI
jgi:hypothetical protein